MPNQASAARPSGGLHRLSEPLALVPVAVLLIAVLFLALAHGRPEPQGHRDPAIAGDIRKTVNAPPGGERLILITVSTEAAQALDALLANEADLRRILTESTRQAEVIQAPTREDAERIATAARDQLDALHAGVTVKVILDQTLAD